MARHHTSAIRIAPLIILLGCSPAPLYTNEPPVELGQQIAGTDRVVLTDSNGLAPVRVGFSGAEAQKLVHAISESKKMNMREGDAPLCPGGMYIGFYRGTNLLAQVAGHDDHFHTSEAFYHDASGALRTAWQAVYDERSR